MRFLPASIQTKSLTYFPNSTQTLHLHLKFAFRDKDKTTSANITAKSAACRHLGDILVARAPLPLRGIATISRLASRRYI